MGVFGLAVGAGVGAVVIPTALAATGFASAGVVAGSCAAGVQSLLGNVAAGSLFSALQSTAAVGVSAAAMATTAAVGGIAGALKF